MKNETYIKVINEAYEIVKHLDNNDLQKIAFGIVLKRLIDETTDVMQPSAPDKDLRIKTTSKELSEEEVNTLFQVNEDGKTIKFKVRPTGATTQDQQLMLMHTVLMAYHLLLKEDSVKATTIGEVARYWNLHDVNLSRTFKTSDYIQIRGKSKGVVYSFKPGAVAKLTDVMRKMAYGE